METNLLTFIYLFILSNIHKIG